MRVCDITGTEKVAGRFLVLEVPLEYDNQGIQQIHDARVVHDLEVGESAGLALEQRAWGELHRLTPSGQRKKNESRSEAAKKAANTRAANRAKEAPAVTNETKAADLAG